MVVVVVVVMPTQLNLPAAASSRTAVKSAAPLAQLVEAPGLYTKCLPSAHCTGLALMPACTWSAEFRAADTTPHASSCACELLMANKLSAVHVIDSVLTVLWLTCVQASTVPSTPAVVALVQPSGTARNVAPYLSVHLIVEPAAGDAAAATSSSTATKGEGPVWRNMACTQHSCLVGFELMGNLAMSVAPCTVCDTVVCHVLRRHLLAAEHATAYLACVHKCSLL